MWDWFAQLDANWQTLIWLGAIAALTNAACAVVGCYLVLRRMSLLGDAISHAVLPGLVVAYMLAGTLNVAYLFLGALTFGLLTAVLTELIHKQGSVPEDSSMGVVFTSLFALGVILIKRYGQSVDLDPDCVLNGLLEMADDNLWVFAGYEVPRALVTMSIVLALNLGFVALFWKELLVSSFDPALGTSMGFRSGLIHYLLMALVALTTVASFEQVGSILVVAMLVVPAATAHLLCDRLASMLLVAISVAVGAAIAGLAAAVWYDVNTAGAMAVAVGLFYAAAVLGSPNRGLLTTLARNWQNSLRIVCEDLLAMLYRVEEAAPERPLDTSQAIAALGGGLLPRLALWRLTRLRQVQRVGRRLELAAAGRHQATQLVRSHRLWETYLVQQLGLPLDHVHEPAMRMEHYIGRQLQEELTTELDQAATDPHGRQIPGHEPSDHSG